MRPALGEADIDWAPCVGDCDSETLLDGVFVVIEADRDRVGVFTVDADAMLSSPASSA